MKRNGPIEILLVEDSSTDAHLIDRSLQEGDVQKSVHIVSDGVEALDFLHRREPFADAPRPDLILLDLDLPRLNGMEVLEHLAKAPELATIPVIVLTASAIAEDVLAAYRLQASCYIAKPPDLDGFTDVVQAIESFWFNQVELPPRNTRGQISEAADA